MKKYLSKKYFRSYLRFTTKFSSGNLFQLHDTEVIVTIIQLYNYNYSTIIQLFDMEKQILKAIAHIKNVSKKKNRIQQEFLVIVTKIVHLIMTIHQLLKRLRNS